MIRYFPQLYEDELLFSWLTRMYAHSPYTTSSTFKKTIFRRENEPIDYLFYNGLSDEAYKSIDDKFGIKNLIQAYTLVPFYSSFFLADEKKRIMNRAVRLQPSITHFLSFPTVHCSYVRFCPLCAQESTEIYFTRKANILGIDYCPIHHCRLNTTDIRTDKERFSSFKTLDQINLDLSVADTLDESDINIRFAKYVVDFLRAKQNYKNNIPIGIYLGSKLEGTKYLSPRGGQKNLDVLLSDMELFYRGYKGWDITKPRLATIFRDSFINIIDILLIAYFIGITADELQHPSLPPTTQTERFDFRVRELSQQGYKASEIASMMSVNKEVVRQVLMGKYIK